MSKARTRGSELDVERFFKERKKAPDNFFFSPDGKSLVARTKDGEKTIPITIATHRTPEELNVAYQERSRKLATLEEQHDMNIRALLDAQERGETDDIILSLNRACEVSDSALFQEHWANKRIVPYSGLEIRTVDLEQKREVRKFPTDVYVFEGRRVGLDYEYSITEQNVPESVEMPESVAKLVVLPATVVAGREELVMTGPIEFSAKSEKYREFSTFYPSPISLDSKVYPTVEHYLQAMKFPSDKDYQELIRRSKDAITAKKLGTISDPSRPIRPDWDTVRDDVMRRALDAKFRQNPELGLLLTETGSRTLTEVSMDIYWGVGKAKSGKNRLGQILAELRAKLQTESGVSIEPAMASASTATVPVVSSVQAPPAPGKIRLKVKPKTVVPPTAVAASADETSRSIIQSALAKIGATVPAAVPTAAAPTAAAPTVAAPAPPVESQAV